MSEKPWTLADALSVTGLVGVLLFWTCADVCRCSVTFFLSDNFFIMLLETSVVVCYTNMKSVTF